MHRGHPALASVVRDAGDVDADGTGDFAISDPRCNVVWVLSGAKGTVLLRIASTEPATAFGCDVSAIGDLDGDRCTDLLVGSGSREWDWKLKFPARTGFVVVSGRTGQHLRAVARRDSSTFAGFVEGLGDVDADGMPDYAVGGAPPGAEDASEIFATIYSGCDGRVLHLVPARTVVPSTTPGLGIELDAGGALCRLGDVDGDGHADFVSGFTIFSGKDGTPSLARFETVALVLRDAQGRLGLAGGRDLDGDGIPDFVAGSPGSFVAAFSGRTGRVVSNRLPQVGHMDDMGAAVALLPDVDGDLRAEIVYSSPDEGIAEGSVRAISSRDGHELWKAHGADDGDAMAFHFGSTLDVVGDVDADGSADVIVGVDHSQYHGRGRAFVLSGRTGRPIQEFIWVHGRIVRTVAVASSKK